MKRLYLTFLCLLLATAMIAQGKKKKPSSFNKQTKETDQFLQKQWWLGFKAGPNISKAVVERSYSGIAPTNYQSSEIGKKYQSFNKAGSQATLEITFYFKGVSLSFQPTYRHNRFTYSNRYAWSDLENANNRLDLNYAQEQKVDYADFPLVLKYEFTGNKLRPYVQVGGYSALLLNATKSVDISGVDYASGGQNEFKNETIIVGATDLFAKNHWGMIGGAGVNYNLGNVRVNFDITYKYGMSNITSTKNRFGSDRLSGVGDVLDDMTLNSFSFSIGALFPMRFLADGFKSLDRK
ncbi:MAG: hypothetical protein ACOYXT_11455 [Bacteroidota bacterium]